MNYFAHALPFLDEPYFLAGTALPDWLTVSDRAVRLRSKNLSPWIDDADPVVRAVARGALQHLRDDDRFHRTPAFAQTSLELTVAARDVLHQEPGLRPSFLGHLLTELLLDAALIAEQPAALERYWQVVGPLDPAAIQAAVARMAPRPPQRLAWFIGLFLQERILSDYLDDAKLMVRLNQIMRRVGLPLLPDGFRAILPAARRVVRQRRGPLLDGIPVADRLCE